MECLREENDGEKFIIAASGPEGWFRNARTVVEFAFPDGLQNLSFQRDKSHRNNGRRETNSSRSGTIFLRVSASRNNASLMQHSKTLTCSEFNYLF